VQIIQPGRFSIIYTQIDNPDVMKFELKVLTTLKSYCARPDGKYPPPADIFTLGPPDMPVENIAVQSPADKNAYWLYPYKRLEGGAQVLTCRAKPKTEEQWFMEQRANITNGFQWKKLVDCRRGLMGTFYSSDDDDPSKVIVGVIRPGTVGEDEYLRICLAVMHERPYLPERSGAK